MVKDGRGTIRPPEKLVDVIDAYLGSNEAKNLGFTTRTSVVEHLLRSFIERNYHSPNIMTLPKDIQYEIKQDEVIFRMDGEQLEMIVKHTSKDTNILICTRCHDPDCIYRNFVLENEVFWPFLRDHGVFLKRPRYKKATTS